MVAAGCGEFLVDPFEYAEIEVVTVRRSGEPAPGVGLTLYTGTRELERVVTGSEGRYLFRLVPAGGTGVFAEPPPDLYRPIDLADGYFVTTRVREGDRLRFTFSYLKYGDGEVVARVREPDGTPVAEVPLLLYDPRGIVEEGRTASDGSFAFAPVPLGDYGVFALPTPGITYPDGPMAIADGLVIDEGHREEVVFIAERCRGGIRVGATDTAGAPIPGLLFSLYTPTQVLDEQRTGADGVVDFGTLPCGEYGVTLERTTAWTPVGTAAEYFVDGILVRNGTVEEIQLRFREGPGPQ